jgi:hypothetical protein
LIIHDVSEMEVHILQGIDGIPKQELELFPRWQMGQYLHDMFCSHHLSLDNHRYPHLKWTGAQSFLSNLLNPQHRATSG